MKSRSFALKPFREAEAPPGMKITGTAGRHSNTFFISFELSGTLSKLAVPAPAASPRRRNGLWEETCLEFFLAAENAGGYREFNLSPSGDWNVYRFTSYRQGMVEEQAFASLPFRVERRPGALGLSLEFGLDKIKLASRPLEVAVSAVVKPVDSALTYWALRHPGPEPDFHHRGGFIIKL